MKRILLLPALLFLVSSAVVIVQGAQAPAVPPGPPRSESLPANNPHAGNKESIRNGMTLYKWRCGECHGLDQKGDPGGGIPNLAVAKAYSLEEFADLMHNGVAKGGRQIRSMMAETARRRFSVFSTEEIAALKTYLDSREP